MSDRQSFEVDLPTRGLVYPDHPQLSTGKVNIFVMRAKEEKVLAGMRTARGRTQDSLNKLVRDNTREDFDPDELTITDWYFLLVRIRVISYGDDHEFEVRCRNCSEIFEHKVNISEDMELTMLPEDFEEPFLVELPVLKVSVGMRLLRGSDERRMFNLARQAKVTKGKRQRKRATIKDPSTGTAGPLESATYIPRIAAQILTVDGVEMDGREKVSWVENLTVRDSRHLQKEAAEQDCGYSGRVTVVCPQCAYDFETLLPWDADFFPWGGS